MLPCDLREKGDDDDLEISLVVIVVAEESRINQVALVKREREREKRKTVLDANEHGAYKRPPLDCLFSFSSVLAMRYV
jgi:hypothetical protein